MTRKIRPLRLAGALVATSALVALAGCSNAAPQPAEASLDFTFTYPSNQNSPYETLAELYMDANPDAEVTLNPIPADSYDAVLNTQLQAGNASDVILATPGSGTPIALLSLADASLIAPLGGIGADLIPDTTAALFYTGDDQWGLPQDISITGTVFNSSAGVDYPRDESGLMSTCASLDDGVSMFALAGSIPINTGLAAVSVAATRVYAENPDWDAQRAAGEVTFADTPGWRDTLQLMVDMQTGGCYQPGAEGGGFDAIVMGIGQGASLSAFLPGGAATDLAGEGSTLVVEPFPGPDGSEPFVFVSSDFAFAINAKSPRQEAAQAFLSWFAEPENAQAFAAAAGSLPVTGVEDLDLAGTPYEPVASLIEDGSYTALPMTVWTSQDVFLVLGSGVQGLLTGQKTVDQVLAELDAAWDAS